MKNVLTKYIALKALWLCTQEFVKLRKVVKAVVYPIGTLCLAAIFLALLPAAQGQITIMPMGDSITVGVDYLTQSSGGYRDPLYRDLIGAGLSFTLVGAANGNTSPALTAAGNAFHNGYGSWHIQDLNNNLDGVAAPLAGGDSNQGGYFLTGGHGTGRSAVFPTIILLHIGTNDLLQGTPTINQDLYTLVTHIHALSPATVILIAGVIPINNSGSVSAVNAYNSYIKNQLVPSLFYTRFVDQNIGFLNPDGTINGALLGTDLIHPNRFGYPIVAQTWASAIESLESVGTGKSATLTVANGSGSGSYPAGSVVTVSANSPSTGTQFATWTPGTTALSNPFASLTTYLMPSGPATLTAHYSTAGSPVIPDGTYNIVSPYDNLSVGAAGSGNGSAMQQQTPGATTLQNWDVVNLGSNVVSLMLSGTREAIEAPSANAGTLAANLDLLNYTAGANQQWSLVPTLGTTQIMNRSSGEYLNIQGYSTAPGAPLLQYTTGFPTEFWNFYPVAGAQATYPLTVANGSGGGSYPAGSSVTVTANAAASGFTFSGWAGATSGMSDPAAATTTLVTPAIASTVTATYAATPATYLLTVNSGAGGGTYPTGKVIAITANSAPSGYAFSGWSGVTGALANPAAASTTLTMPASATTVTATYSPSPTATAALPPGSNLGSFFLLNEAASQGNSMVISYGQSYEGDDLNTYWQSSTPGMTVLSMGASLYEIVENAGGRCLTVNGSVVTITTCAARPSQLFALKLQADGSYTIQSGTSCVEAPGSFATVDALPCTSSLTQRWLFSGSKPLTLGSPATVYALTVNNGSGGGSYPAGSTVTVSANPVTTGYTFSGWTGASAALANANAATTTLTMPAAASAITATYTAASFAPATGSNLGSFFLLNEAASQGNSMVISYGQSYEGDDLNTYWQSSTPGMTVLSMGASLYEIVENAGGRCLTVNGSVVTITACAANANQLLSLSPQADGSYTIQLGCTCVEAPGSFTRVDALPCGASLTQRWVFSGAKPLNLGSSATVYALTVNNGSGSGSYPASNVVTVTANAPANGYIFSGWTGATGALANPNAATTILTMPAGNTTVTSTYAPTSATSSAAGTNLGAFSLLNEAATQGNSLAVLFGQSIDGAKLTTYWQSSAPAMTVLSMGGSLYEVVENTGGRCLTVNGSAATISTCTGAAPQLFLLNPQADGAYTIQGGSGFCLEAAGAFALVDASVCGTSSSQRWLFSGSQPLTLGSASPAAPVASAPSSTVPAGYHLTFDDEFTTLSIADKDGAGTNWYTHTVQCCLSDTSAPSTQTYMAGITDGPGKDPYSLVTGGLDIRLQKTNGAWYSGVLATVDRTGRGFSQKYGYFEMKAKFPAAIGTWPAFWLLNAAALSTQAPAGEIDVVESYMFQPNAINITLHDWTPPATTPAYHESYVADLSNGFHTFGMLWTASTMSFYCDGTLLYTTPTPAIMNQPYYPIVDLGLGGGWPTNQTPSQSDLIVQYVRVYSSN